jgi:hypothetical protein
MPQKGRLHLSDKTFGHPGAEEHGQQLIATLRKSTMLKTALKVSRL